MEANDVIISAPSTMEAELDAQNPPFERSSPSAPVQVETIPQEPAGPHDTETGSKAHSATLQDPPVEHGLSGEVNVLPVNQPEVSAAVAGTASAAPLESPDPAGPGRASVPDQPELQEYDYVVSSDDSEETGDVGSAETRPAAAALDVDMDEQDQIDDADDSQAGPAVEADNGDIRPNNEDAQDDDDEDGDSDEVHEDENDSEDKGRDGAAKVFNGNNADDVAHHDHVDLMGEEQDGVGDDEKLAAEEGTCTAWLPVA